MKFALSLASLFLSFSALANPINISLSCKGHVLAAGDTGRRGDVLITGTNPNTTTYNNVWTLGVSWKNEAPSLGLGVVCGQKLDAALKCVSGSQTEALDRLGFPHPLALATICDDAKEVKVPPRHSLEARIVLDQTLDHGRYSCDSNSGKVNSTIELSDCKPTQTANLEK